MPNYRRMRVPGGTYFFTVRLAAEGADGLIWHLDVLREAVRDEILASPFEIVETVVLPDHMHAIWRLPAGDSDYSSRWKRIKAAVTRRVAPSVDVSPSKAAKGERGFWQRRFWEHTIRSEAELAYYRRYCWHNPVKHGLVRAAGDWHASSFHRAVRQGEVAQAWRSAA